jgi:O-antigen ligase
LLGCAFGLYQVIWFKGVATGGAGNPSVLGFILAILAVLSLANLASEVKSRRWMAVAGFSAAVIGLFLSQTRTLYPLVPILPIIYAYFNRRSIGKMTAGQAIFASILLLGTAIYFSPKVIAQYSDAQTDLELADAGRYETSLGIRVALWTASLSAIEKQPLIGFGPLDKMDAVRENLPEGLKYFGATHVHNAYIDATVAGGIAGGLSFFALLGAPLLLVRRTASAVSNGAYRFSIVGLTATAALNSVTNLLLTQDLMTVVYLFPLVVIAANSE